MSILNPRQSMSLDLTSIYLEWKHLLLSPTGLFFSSQVSKSFNFFWEAKTKRLLNSVKHRLTVFILCIVVISIQYSLDMMFSKPSTFTLLLVCSYIAFKYGAQILRHFKRNTSIEMSSTTIIAVLCSIMLIKGVPHFFIDLVVCLIELVLLTRCYLLIVKRVICIVTLRKVLKTLPPKIKCTETGLSLCQRQLLEEEALLLLEAARKDCCIQSLDLSGAELSHSSFCVIKDLLSETNSLESLYLSGSRMNLQNLTELTQGIANNHSVRSLNLSSNKLGPNGAKTLARVLKTHINIREIDLSRNDIGDQGMTTLSNVFRFNTSLKKVNLWGNRIGHEGARLLCSALFLNMHVVELDLAENRIGIANGDVVGISFVADLIERNQVLECLDLSGNNIDIKGFGMLSKALLNNNTLKVINLARNDFVVHNSRHIHITSVVRTWRRPSYSHNRINVPAESTLLMDSNYHLVVSLVFLLDYQEEIADLFDADWTTFDPKTCCLYVTYTGENAEARCQEASTLNGFHFKRDNLLVKSIPNVPQAEPTVESTSQSSNAPETDSRLSKCNICHKTANEQTALACGHTVCTLQCLVSWVKKYSSCPTCNSAIHGVVVSHNSFRNNDPSFNDRDEMVDLFETDFVTFDSATGTFYVFYTGWDAEKRYEYALFLDGIFFKGETLSVESYIKDCLFRW
ncbi:hypothetical protein P9112_014284 [Eukaryota sp. TZLM1-RC]